MSTVRGDAGVLHVPDDEPHAKLTPYKGHWLHNETPIQLNDHFPYHHHKNFIRSSLFELVASYSMNLKAYLGSTRLRFNEYFFPNIQPNIAC